MTTPTNPPETTPSAVERADALLSRWGQRLNPADKSKTPALAEAAPPEAPPAAQASGPETGQGTVRRADSLLGRMGHRMSGRGLVEAAAYGYVALAVRTGRAANAVQKTWLESVQEARHRQEQQAAQTGGPSAARQVAADEKKGENVLKRTEFDVAADAEKGADVAVDAAG